MLNCYRLRLRENILSYSAAGSGSEQRICCITQECVSVCMCTHWSIKLATCCYPFSNTHHALARIHTHLILFFVRHTERRCVCVFSSLTFQSTHMHTELSRHVGSCLCRGCVCHSAHYSYCLPVERVGTETNRSVATATHTKEVEEQQESDKLKTCEEGTQQVGTGHRDFRNLWVGLEA